MRPSRSTCFLILLVLCHHELLLCYSAAVSNTCQTEKVSRVLVMDAGSTGTRLLYYEFTYKRASDKRMLKPLDVKFTKAESISKKAAISSFDKVAKLPSLRRLIKAFLDDAEKHLSLPDECLAYVPIFFKATAGVRAMPKILQKLILDAIQEVFKASKFKKVKNNVSVMTGLDEGIYAWITLNYAEKLLDLSALDKTHSLLEIGGGSMQLATSEYNEQSSSLMKEFNLLGQKFSLIVKSYLGLGIEAARIFFFDDANTGVCIHKDAKIDYVFGSVKRALKGKAINDNERYDICTTIAKALVTNIDPVWENVKDPGQIDGIRSFYFPVSNANYLLNDCKNNGETDICKKTTFKKSINELETDAKKLCANPPTENKFHITICIDLTYAINALKNGFKISDLDKKLTFANTFNEIEIKWSFGVAYEASFKTFSSAPRVYAYSLMSIFISLIVYLYNLTV